MPKNFTNTSGLLNVFENRQYIPHKGERDIHKTQFEGGNGAPVAPLHYTHSPFVVLWRFLTGSSCFPAQTSSGLWDFAAESLV